MTEEEIREYIYRKDELLLKLSDKDKYTLEWILFGYNECARLLDEKEKENQQLKEQLERSEKARKDVYDYINFLVIIDTQLAGGRFKDTIWGKELLEILDIDKGE